MSATKNTSSIFTALEKVLKFQDNKNYLNWKRTVRDHLELFELWTYIATPKIVFGDASKFEDWTAGQERTCTALKLVVNGNAYNNVKDLTYVFNVWDLLKANFKARGSGFLNNSIKKLFFLSLSDCKDTADYITQFCGVFNKLKSFTSKFQLDKNILMIFFQYNLSNKHSRYC